MTWSRWIACWNVGTEAFRGSLLGSVDECCGAAEVLIAETEVLVKWRWLKPRQLGFGLADERNKDRRAAWGFRTEMTKGSARIVIAASLARLRLQRTLATGQLRGLLSLGSWDWRRALAIFTSSQRSSAAVKMQKQSAQSHCFFWNWMQMQKTKLTGSFLFQNHLIKMSLYFIKFNSLIIKLKIVRCLN